MSEETQTTEQSRGLRKERVGIVVSDKMEKTIVVEYTARVPHPKFKKIILGYFLKTFNYRPY